MYARDVVIFSMCMLLGGGASAAKCSLPELESESNEHPACLFFVGTKNFREENYAAAFGSWERLRTLAEVPEDFRKYQISAYNNLGYLYYMGLARIFHEQ